MTSSARLRSARHVEAERLINRVQGDRYAGEWPREHRKRGITYQVADKSKSDLYVGFLPLLNRKKVSLLDHPRSISQLCSMERRSTRVTGRNLVDHPVSGHDDLSNVIAGCLAPPVPSSRSASTPVSLPNRCLSGPGRYSA
jgi:hypothetical protein